MNKCQIYAFRQDLGVANKLTFFIIINMLHYIIHLFQRFFHSVFRHLINSIITTR